MSARYRTKNDIKRMWRNRFIAAAAAVVVFNPYSPLQALLFGTTAPAPIRAAAAVWVGFFVYSLSELPCMVLDFNSRTDGDFPDGTKRGKLAQIFAFGGHMTCNYYRNVVKKMAVDEEDVGIPSL